MTDSDPNRFGAWRATLATMSTTQTRLIAFRDASFDIAQQVGAGKFDKTTGVDELIDEAQAYGLMDQLGREEVERVIADAFNVPVMNGKTIAPGQSGQAVTNEVVPKILSVAEFVKGFIPPDYLVDGMLQRRFIYALTGQTGHAKTAVALLLSQLVGSADKNAMLGKHRVEKGRVIYFVGENPDDVRMRVIGADAQREAWEKPTDDNVWFVPGVFNIRGMMHVLADDMRRNGDASLVIVDTSAAYFLGNEELSNTQMGAYARMLRGLTTLPGGPCVLVLCHPIKHATDPSQLVPRGGGAYLAEVDGNLTLWRHTDDMVELYHTKMRGAGFQAITFQLETIKTSQLADRKGRPIPTVRAVAISDQEEERKSKTAQNGVDRVLMAMLAEPEGSLASWAASCDWVADNGEPYKKKVQRIIERLADEKPKLAFKYRNRWHLTDGGKEEARKVAVEAARQKALQAGHDQPELFKSGS
jgi:hypothetical protein